MIHPRVVFAEELGEVPATIFGSFRTDDTTRVEEDYSSRHGGGILVLSTIVAKWSVAFIIA
jgi:hypothetical protein